MDVQQFRSFGQEVVLVFINIPKAVTADIYFHYRNKQEEKRKLLEKYFWIVLMNRTLV